MTIAMFLSRWARKIMQAETIAILGAIFSISGGAFATYATIVNSRKQAERAQAAAAKSDEIARLNKEIAELTKDAQAAITGGDSFVYLQLADALETGVVEFDVIADGKHPVYDAYMTVTDQNQVVAMMKEYEARTKDKPFRPIAAVMGPEALEAGVRRFAIGTLNPSSALHGVPGMKWRLGPVDDRGFLVQTSARNGYMVQVVRLTKVNGRWQAGTRVTKTNASGSATVVREVVGPDFPRQPDGTVDWSRPLPPLK